MPSRALATTRNNAHAAMIRTAKPLFHGGYSRSATLSGTAACATPKVSKVGASKVIRLPAAFSVRPITTQISLVEIPLC